MPTNTPRGFVPAYTLNGTNRFMTHRYKVSADNATSLFPGDLVVLNAGGGIESWITADASTAATQEAVLGVVARCLDSNGKPFTHSQPTRGPFLNASTGGYVEVYDDPDTVFTANCSASASQEMIGKLCPVVFGAQNSAAGRSGWGVDAANAVVSAAGDQVLRFIGVAEGPGEFPNTILGAGANNDVHVQIADHHFRRSHQRTGTG